MKNLGVDLLLVCLLSFICLSGCGVDLVMTQAAVAEQKKQEKEQVEAQKKEFEEKLAEAQKLQEERAEQLRQQAGQQ